MRTLAVVSVALVSLVVLAAFPGRAEAKLAELLVTDAGVKKPIALEQASVEAQIDFSSARVTYDLTFLSNRIEAQEGTFYFALPRNSYVHEFGMWVNGKYQGSAIVEAKAGRVAYESIVRRGVDPALLEWTAGNTFKMRVFPIVRGKPTRIKLTVGMPAELANGQLRYALPLDLGKVETFKLAVEGRATTGDLPVVTGLKGLKLKQTDEDDGVLEFAGSVKESSYLPPDEVRLAIAESKPARPKVRREDGDDERHFEMRVFPELATKARPAPDRAIVLWDFSLSEAEGHAARLAALRAYLKARKPATVDLHGFNQDVFVIKTGLSGSDPRAIEDVLARRPYDGGTRLDVLARGIKDLVAKDAAKAADLVLFTNGVDSYELFDFKSVKALGRKNLNAFVIAPSLGAGGPLLQTFARALDAVILDQDADLTPAVFTSLPWRVTKITGSKNLKGLELPSDPNLFAKDGLALRGHAKKDGEAELAVTFQQAGEAKTLKYKIDTDDVTREKTGTLPRLWATQRLARLLPEKRENATEIKDIALRHQLMSPYTVMVVLEFCEDYAEFKLDAPKSCERRPTFEDDLAEEGSEALFDSAADDDSDGESFAEESGDDEAAGGDMMAAQMEPPAASAAAPAAPSMAESAKAAPADAMAMDLAEESEAGDFYGEEAEYRGAQPDADSSPRLYGFEKQLSDAAAKGAAVLYAQYLATRAPFAKIPFYYIYAADLLAAQKRLDLAELVLSNVVEVRPGDARWLRIYAYNLVAWGKAKEAVPIYRAVAELREEDPQSHRDFGLALEAIGEPIGAMRLFEAVYTGKWDARLEGMSRIIQHDLARASAATLKLPGLSPENRAKAQRYAKVDASANDKIVATVSWDTDNTDIDLHVIEPSGAHVYYGDMKPRNSAGTLSWDTTRGFGPEQYRAAAPMRGAYRFYLKYYSNNPNVIQDGTFVRVDFKVVERGVARAFTRTFFLKDRDEVRTILTLDYADPGAPLPPPDFRKGIAAAKQLLQQKRFADGLTALNTLGKQTEPRDEALRHFHLARARLGLRQFEQAEQDNQRALALDPTLLSAHFNNACAQSLAKNAKKSVHHLNLLADALRSRPDKRSYYLRIMETDSDLTFVRGTKSYNSVMDRMRVGH